MIYGIGKVENNRAWIILMCPETILRVMKRNQ